MKKFLSILIVLAGITSLSFAQTELNYETHGLIPGTVNEMQMCNYADPGPAGEDVIWDFSGLEKTKAFEGTIEKAHKASSPNLSTLDNAVLQEFNNQFYLNNNAEKCELVGVVSNSKPVFSFEKPFVKMKYPFSYGDQFSGDYFGTYYAGEKEGEMEGSYSVTGDAYGTLILPDKTVENALRVKTVRNYTRDMSNNEIKVETYRWYSENERYPLLVLIETSIITEKKTYNTHKAAYRSQFKGLKNNSFVSNEIAREASIKAYPNPSEGDINYDYFIPESGAVNISLFNNKGEEISLHYYISEKDTHLHLGDRQKGRK